MISRNRWRGGLLVLIAAAVAAALVGANTGGAGGSKGTIIMFGPTSSNNYVAQLYKGARETARKRGYTLRIIENNFNQADQDVQVQQQLASGNKPVAYGWWPSDNKAGIASQRALARSGVPVFMVNQLPIKGTERFWVAYAGVNDVLNGFVAGKMTLQARRALVRKGHRLASRGGNVIVVRFVAGYSAGDDRDRGFARATKGSGLRIIAKQSAGFDPASGYKFGAQLIAANRRKGIDLVYAHNSALAAGVVQALEEAGYRPGQNVMVVGGTCHGNIRPLLQGKEFGTGLQAARLEGVYMLEVISKYLQTKRVRPGRFNAPATRNRMPPIRAVYRYNFIPNPAVIGQQALRSKLWGFTMRQLCTY
jgi:ABC-type sugar transport system substrate-binding protein